MKHTKTWVSIAVLVLATGAYAAYASLKPGPPVAAIKVEAGPVRSFVEERAITSLPTTVVLTMPFDGQIEPITLVPGTEVAAGEVVAKINSDDLEDEVAAAKAELAAVDARLAVMADNALESTALLEFKGWIEAMTKLEASAKELISANESHAAFSEWWEQAEAELKDQGAVADEKYRRAKTESSEAAVDLAVAKLNHQLVLVVQTIVSLGPKYVQDYLGRKGLEAAVLERERAVAAAQLAIAERRLARAEIKAPSSGLVLERHVESAQQLPAGALLLTLGEPDALRVTADLLSEDASQVQIGDSVQVYGPGLGSQELSGTVKRVDPQGFTKVSSLGVDQQRVHVVIDLDDGELARLQQTGLQLGLAYRVHVRIFTDQTEDTLAVPRMALLRDTKAQHGDGTGGTGWALYLVVNGRAALTPVELGIGNPERMQIIKGLSKGDIVLTMPPKTLKEGDKVSPQFGHPHF